MFGLQGPRERGVASQRVADPFERRQPGGEGQRIFLDEDLEPFAQLVLGADPLHGMAWRAREHHAGVVEEALARS